MGNKRHARSGRGVFAVCGWNYDGSESERHCERAYCADENRFWDRKQIEKTNRDKRDNDQSDKCYRVDADIGQNALHIYFGDRHTRKKHSDGGHTVSTGVDNVHSPVGELKSCETDDHSDDHTDEHRVEKIFQSRLYAFVGAVNRH